ncbi:H-NS histone family protein [Jannaschia ovalis]|uniref:H-NS histone family protein n=1 Tax=Jannaschia ovalis TaxID=3038773 RepID=A0ABY8LFI2_9RHOB|nr:H-NS histone family protein [Jannaschia sp. GRR-S6-38]WGH80067.1 H-NS histone family protein [Jannaschia sp. GRR-S6-38]
MSDVKKMSREQLEKEAAEAEARLRELRKAQEEFDGRRLKELRGEIEAMLGKEGFTLADLFGGKQGKKPVAGAAKAPAKYRHPENGALTWSGRGRQPGWYKEALAQGKKPEDLAI